MRASSYVLGMILFLRPIPSGNLNVKLNSVGVPSKLFTMLFKDAFTLKYSSSVYVIFALKWCPVPNGLRFE